MACLPAFHVLSNLCHDRDVKVTFEPGEYMRKTIFQSVTGGSEEKNRVLVIGVERMTFWLLVSVASLVFCSSVVERRDAALPLSYRRLGLV